MTLYKLFSSQVEIQYKSYLLSKATFFTLITILLNIILPFVIAYRSRGFWLKSQSFYEQPIVHFTYEYLLAAETDGPGQSIICSEVPGLEENEDRDNCVTIEVEEIDFNEDGKTDTLNIKFRLDVSPERILISLILVLGLNFQLKSVCPMHMQSLVVVSKDFPSAVSSYNYYGDLQLYQTSHLPCFWGHVDIKYNNSLLNFTWNEWNDGNVADFILKQYFNREVTIQSKTVYESIQYAHTDTVFMNINLRIPEMQVRYTPSILQEIKWAWPQYLSMVVIFYWLLNKLKRFVFRKRLFMAWEIIPWKIPK